MFEMQIGSRFMEGIAFVFISVCAVFDIRKREIPLMMLIFGICTALGMNLWQIFNGALSMAEAGFALLPGVFLLFISFCTREKVGYGDGLLLLISGLLIGFYSCCLSFFIGLICSSICALFLMVLRKAEKNSEMPFAPFLVIGLGVGFFV